MIIGLTGGIGSGKSAVAKFFLGEGITVIDADELSREVIEPGTTGFKRVLENFSTEILDPNGCIDRSKLRIEVFDSPEKKIILESITHPLVRDLLSQRIIDSKSL